MASTSAYEVDDTSPLILYQPPPQVSDNLTTAWLPFYTNTGFAPSPGAIGNGTSYHVTSFSGATLSLSWNGTGIKLLGNATNAAYDIILDKFLVQPNSSATADNVLAAFRNLSNTEHTITLLSRTSISLSPDSVLAFDKAVVDFPPPEEGQSVVSRPLPDAGITFTGGTWRNTTALAGSQSAYHITSDPGASASLRFNGTGISVFGHTSPDSGFYRVSLDGVQSSFTGLSTFTQPDTLLFLSMGLNAGVPHSLTIFNDGGGPLAIRAGGGFAVINTEPVTPIPTPPSLPPFPSPSSSSISHPSQAITCSKGTIAALVLAGTLALLAICGSLFYFLYWRPRARRKRRERRQMLRQRRKLESMRDSRREDKGFGDNILSLVPDDHPGDGRDLDEEQDFGYPLIGAYSPDKAEDSTALPPKAFVISKKSKGKERAADADLSNITLEIELPNLPRPTSTPSLRKRAASWGSALDIRRVASRHNSADGSHVRQTSQDQLLSPEEADDPEDARPDTPPFGEIAALSLSPRTVNLPSRQGHGRRAGRARRASSSDDKLLLNLPELSPLQVDFSEAGLRRSREQADSATSPKGKPSSRPKGSRAMRPRASRRRQSPGEGTSRDKSEDSSVDPRRIFLAPSILDGSTAERQSFLDLSSSNPSTRSRASRGSHSNTSSSERKKRSSDNSAQSAKKEASTTAPQMTSRWSAATAPSVSIRHIPPSPPPEEQSLESPQRAHPYAPPLLPLSTHLAPLEGALPELSPTESLPVTVSDIHFRHSMSDRGSAPSPRQSRTLGHADTWPSPYAQLPSLTRTLHTRYQPVVPSDPGEPGKPSPPLIVQKVLGLPTVPSVSQSPSTSGTSPSGAGGVSRPPSLSVAETPRPGPRSQGLHSFLPSGLRIPSSFSRSKTSMSTSPKGD